MMSGLVHPFLTRRGFLGAGAAVLGAGALPPDALAQAPKHRRYEISDPNTPPRIRDSYKRAVAAMLQLPPADPRNWYRNAFVHIFDCPHGNWWFLPWHRAYLGWFERTCRELGGDQEFALPYWDWTSMPRVPAAMFEDVLDPNNTAFVASFTAFKTEFEPAVAALWSTFSQPQSDVLAQRGLNSPADFWDVAERMFFDQPNARGLTAADPDLDPATRTTVSIRVIRRALGTPTFAGSASGTDPVGFVSAKAANHNEGSRKGILESQPHDNVHGAMGGVSGLAFMVSFLSPVDPIFFLHHANLDRLWDVWTRGQAALGRPTLPEGADLAAWADEQFLFFSDEKGQPAPKTNAGDYAAMKVFDYDYSPGSGEEEVPAAGLLSQRFSARITSPTLGAGEPAGGIAEVPAAALRATAPEAPSPVAEVTLSLGPADEGRRFRVLVSPPGGGDPIEAGAITVFGHHAHMGPTTFAVPLPENLAPAAAAGAERNVALDIRIVPFEQAGGGLPSRTVGADHAGPSSAPRLTAIDVRA